MITVLLTLRFLSLAGFSIVLALLIGFILALSRRLCFVSHPLFTHIEPRASGLLQTS